MKLLASFRAEKLSKTRFCTDLGAAPEGDNSWDGIDSFVNEGRRSGVCGRGCWMLGHRPGHPRALHAMIPVAADP